MIDFRPTLFAIGVLLTTIAGAMLLPAATDGVLGNSDWSAFLLSAAVTAVFGIALTLAFKPRRFELTVKQTFILTTVSWIVVAAFAGLPFALSSRNLSPTDAYFEAMSGLTTTGSTVMVGLDATGEGLLLWRALLQWLGGIGIIGMAVAVLPLLRVGGMQLFLTESSYQSERSRPRAASLASSIAAIYVGLTALWVALLWAAGMSGFEAVCHGMTTIATGGYSTSDDSIGHFDSALIDGIVIVGMIVGSLPFVRYYQAVRGEPGALWRDSQVQWFLATCAVMVILLAAWQWLTLDSAPLDALRAAAFNTISVITGTGYVTADYGQWGSFALTLMFFLMFVGGCTSGTTGGIKVFRYQVLFSALEVQIARLLRPHGVLVPHYNGRPIPDRVTGSVLGFFFVFFLAFTVTTFLLALHGYDFVTSVSGAATAIANVGPGLGDEIGPSGTFTRLSDSAKWILSAAMLLGRLELFTVLVLFLPAFWRT